MKTLFDKMPGKQMPVKDVTRALAHMWEDQSVEEEETRASQMNIVLHFGLDLESKKALSDFEATLRLSEKFPCRILALCPREYSEREAYLEAKLYSHCHIDGKGQNQSCGEAIILGYAISEAKYLENQLSLWLENDLPTYYWINHLPEDVVEQKYLPITATSTRTFFDSAVEGVGYDGIEWPDEQKVVDLAWYRILPIRQSLGQYLSGYKCSELTEGLCRVVVRCGSVYEAEARQLLKWFEAALNACVDEAQEIVFVTEGCSGSKDMEVEWEFNGDKMFRFQYDKDGHRGSISANFCGSKIEHMMDIHPLAMEQTLQAALFY